MVSLIHLTQKTQKLLEDTDLVKDFLVQAGDAGTSIEAASLADSVKGVMSGRTRSRNH
jgi:hypothetical protein